MIFVEWWLIARLLALLLLAAAIGSSIWLVRKRHWLIRYPVQLFLGLLLFGLLVLLTIVWSLPGNKYSEPVYSPNKDLAVRIVEYNASGLGGADDTVELFSRHGLSSDSVFIGEFDSVKVQNIRWKSDSELEILYRGTLQKCTSTRRVQVRCLSSQPWVQH